MRNITEVYIHCTDTYPEMSTRVADVDAWHKARGWDGIGYHYLIDRDGVIETGRPVDKIGAHVRGHNSASIGVAMVGGKAHGGLPAANFNRSQYTALAILIDRIKFAHPNLNDCDFKGHYEADGNKTCPNFDVRAYMGHYEQCIKD